MTSHRNRLSVPLICLLSLMLLLSGCSGNDGTEEETQAAAIHDMEAAGISELTYDAGDAADWDKAISDNMISGDFSKAMSRFSFQAAAGLLDGAEDDKVFSPVSIYCALALAETGASGETKEELDSLLGINNASGLSGQCNKLILSLSYGQQRCRARAKSTGALNYKSDIITGNSLWFSKDLPVKEEYRENAAEKFYASSYSVNFENPDSDARIQYWIRDMTNGVIYPNIDLPDGTLMAIVNTLYYYGAWQTPFDEEQTVEDNFTLADGESVVTASYCCRTDPEGMVTLGSGYMLSSLQLDNGCEMVIFLPDVGRTVSEFLQSPSTLRLMMEAEPQTACSLGWKIPKFSFGSSYSLASDLKNMGLKLMFTKDAGFENISDEDIFVSDILHEAHISLDEQGVEGAAYTLIAMNGTALLPEQEHYEMNCDRPFIFGVREKNTGAWLFLGVCNDPSGV